MTSHRPGLSLCSKVAQVQFGSEPGCDVKCDESVLFPPSRVHVIRRSGVGRRSGEAIELPEPTDFDPVRFHLNGVVRKRDPLGGAVGGSQSRHFKELVFDDEIKIRLVSARLLSDQRRASGQYLGRQARVKPLKRQHQSPWSNLHLSATVRPSRRWAKCIAVARPGLKSALLSPAPATLALTVMKSRQLSSSGIVQSRITGSLGDASAQEDEARRHGADESSNIFTE